MSRPGASWLAAAQRQLAWFKRQLFGSKSEKRLAIDPALQPSLFAGLIEDAPPPPATETVEITRRKKTRDGAVNDTGLRFDATVPVRVIEVAPPGRSGERRDHRHPQHLPPGPAARQL